MADAPKRIWLQPHMGHRVDEWTWCRDQIEEKTDIEYVRADLYEGLERNLAMVLDPDVPINEALARLRADPEGGSG